jgi:hypothetical protein
VTCTCLCRQRGAPLVRSVTQKTDRVACGNILTVEPDSDLPASVRLPGSAIQRRDMRQCWPAPMDHRCIAGLFKETLPCSCRRGLSAAPNADRPVSGRCDNT